MAALAERLPDSVTSWRREKRGEKSDECWQPGYLPVVEIRTFTCRRKIAWKWVKIHCSPMIRIVTLVRAAPSKCPARDFLLFCLSFCVLPAFPSPPFLLSPLHFFLSWDLPVETPLPHSRNLYFPNGASGTRAGVTQPTTARIFLHT